MRKIAVLLFTLIAFTITVQAQNGQIRMYKGGGENNKNVNVRVHRFGGNELMIPNLSQEQQDQIKKLRLEMSKEITATRNQIAEKRARLNTLQATDNADVKAINKTIDEIASLQAQQMKAKSNFHVKTRALLNDEQKVEFDSRRHHGFGFRNGFGDAQIKAFKFNEGDFDFGKYGNFDTIGEFNEIVIDPMLEDHFEFVEEDIED